MKLVNAFIAIGLVAGQPVLADTAQFKLKDLTCFDVQTLPGDDSLFVTGLLIGHVLGDQDLSPDKLRSTVEEMDQVCGENPDMAAIEAIG